MCVWTTTGPFGRIHQWGRRTALHGEGGRVLSCDTGLPPPSVAVSTPWEEASSLWGGFLHLHFFPFNLFNWFIHFFTLPLVISSPSQVGARYQPVEILALDFIKYKTPCYPVKHCISMGFWMRIWLQIDFFFSYIQHRTEQSSNIVLTTWNGSCTTLTWTQQFLALALVVVRSTVCQTCGSGLVCEDARARWHPVSWW